MSKFKSAFVELTDRDMFQRELDDAQLDVPDFVEVFNSEIVEMFETGSVTFKLNGKEVVMSFVIKGL